MNALPDHASTSAFADLIGLTSRRVQQLVADGKLPKAAHGKIPLKAGIQAIIKLRVESEARPVTASEDDLDGERTRKLRLENDETERILVRVDDAVAAVDFVIGPLLSELAAVPPRVTDDVRVRRKIEDEVSGVLGEVSKRLRQAGNDIRSGRDVLASGTADEPDGVGEEE